MVLFEVLLHGKTSVLRFRLLGVVHYHKQARRNNKILYYYLQKGKDFLLRIRAQGNTLPALYRKEVLEWL